jgi:hypothetical protein
MADQFTADKLAWLDRVMLDPEVTDFDFRFCYWIASRADRSARAVTAFQDTIAKALAATPRGVQKSAKRLTERGHLSVTSRRGFGSKNSYAPVLANTNAGSGFASETRTEEQSNTNGYSNKYERPSVEESLVSSPAISRKGGARATPVPDDFKLEDQSYNWALDKLGSPEAVERSLFRWKNHNRHTGARSHDWQASACNWIDSDAAGRESDKSVHAAADRLAAKVASFDAGPAVTEEQWAGVLSMYARTGHWTRHVDQLGPDPSSPACRAPRHLLIKHGIIKEVAA